MDFWSGKKFKTRLKRIKYEMTNKIIKYGVTEVKIERNKWSKIQIYKERWREREGRNKNEKKQMKEKERKEIY